MASADIPELSIENEMASTNTANSIILEHAYFEEQVKAPVDNDTGDISSNSDSDSDDEIVPHEPVTADTVEEVKVEQVVEKIKSRELKSLLDAAQEANLDTNIAYKRESRKSVDPYSTKDSGKRTMRSHNPDFVARHKELLHGISSHLELNVIKDNVEQKKDIPKTPKRKKDSLIDDTIGGSSVDDVKKSRKSMKVDLANINMKDGKDHFCWRCHRDGSLIQCETCPRAYHTRCLKQPVYNPDRWPCPECLAILQAESTKTRSPAMRDMSLEHLCELLKYAVKRMIGCSGSEPFIHPVDLKAFPDYRNYVVQPMDLTTLQNNIRNNLYGSTVAFMADAKWILHNSIIFNSYQSKLTTAAKSIVKICKQEMSEIETCAECYQNANTKKNSWFVEVCTKPHILLWAKLKGFPYWPAKAMTTNPQGLVDVRFFGAHDRAWIPIKECFLYSKKDPNTTNKNKRNNIAECIKEVDVHIEKLKEIFGEFYYAPYRTPYDPATEFEQLAFMLPKYKPNIKTNIKAVIIPIKIKSEISEIKSPQKVDSKRTSVSSESSISKKAQLRERSRSRASDISEGGHSESKQSDIDAETLTTTSSKTSLTSDGKANLSQDFDKFMEGYGTEDDDIVLNNEVRKKLINYESDSDEEIMKTPNGNSESTEEEKSPENLSEIMLLNRSKVRTRGGYHNVTGKVKVLGVGVTEPNRKRSLNSSPNHFESPVKLVRRNSDMSTKSDSSRISGISDKISRVEEFSDTMEVSLGNSSKDTPTVSVSENVSPEIKIRPEFISSDQINLAKFKPVIQVNTGDLYSKNKEFQISPQSKAISIADRLMKKITESELSTEIEKVESVKKQILDNLESCSSSSNNEVKKDQIIDDVSSSETSNDKQLEQSTVQENTPAENDEKNTKVNGNFNSTDEKKLEIKETVKVDSVDKNQSVSSSTEPSSSKTENIEDKKSATNDTKDAKANLCASTTTSSSSTVSKITVQATTNDKPEPKKEITKKIGIEIVKSIEKPKLIESSNKPDDSLEKMDVDSENDESGENSEKPSTTNSNKVEHNNVKLVNVSDIISGKINEKPTPAPSPSSSTEKQQKLHEIDSIEIKSEPVSEDEETDNTKQAPSRPAYDVTITRKSSINSNEEKTQFKIVDNLTRIIDSVAKNSSTFAASKNALNINHKEITLRPISKLIHTPKQKARKSFPNSPHKIQQTPIQIKRIIPEKKDSSKPQTSLKVISTLQTITTQPTVTSSSTTITPSSTTSKDSSNIMYLATQSSSVANNMALLPPNQPITLTQNVGNSILAMVQNTPSLILQQNPSTSQISTPSTSQCAIITPSADNTTPTINLIPQTPTLSSSMEQAGVLTEDRSSIPESISKAVGDLLCKSPPKLKPKPPGPLSASFDEGTPSSAGPTTELINSVAHRLSDYFRGLLKETFDDLSTIGSPESKIRSLELEIESLKHKHAEEMLELRKNISSILKDIQKSIVEEKAKIVDETRAACEAERVRSVEEAKSKQWCAYCFKEAQFYCCWNTSYCDYPCQQKHWQTHMKTCSQSTVRNAASAIVANTTTLDKSTMNSNATGKQITKNTFSTTNKTVLKPTRMIVKQTNKQGVPMYVPVQRPIQAGQQTITLVESTPGNFEIVGNHGPISLGGKLVPTTTIKVKTGNVITVASTSSSSSSNSTTTTGTASSHGSQKAIIYSQKPPPVVNKSSSENKTN